MTDKTLKDYLKEDAVDQEKHDALNNIAMSLGALETEIAELARLDGDMDSSGVGDLTDQLTTMLKLVNSFEAVIDRATNVVPMESVNEAVDQALIDSVVDQIVRDIEMQDVTAIEELLKSCPEANLRGFLSEVGESVNESHSCGCDESCSCGGHCSSSCNCHSGCSPKIKLVVTDGTRMVPTRNEIARIKRLAGV